MQYPRLKHHIETTYNPAYATRIRKLHPIFMKIVGMYNAYYHYHSRNYYIIEGSVYWANVGDYIVIKQDENIYFNSKHKAKLQSLFKYFQNSSFSYNLIWEKDKFFKDAILSLEVEFKSVNDMKESILKFKKYAETNSVVAVCRI